MKEENPVLCGLVDFSLTSNGFSGRYGHITVKILEREKDSVSGMIYNSVNDLTISCQISEGNSYGYSVEYRDTYTVDLRRAEGMSKLLRKIETGMNKLDETRGYTSEFGVYVGRVMEIIKAEFIVIRTCHFNSDTPWSVRVPAYFPDDFFRFLSLGSGIDAINKFEKQLMEETLKDKREDSNG